MGYPAFGLLVPWRSYYPRVCKLASLGRPRPCWLSCWRPCCRRWWDSLTALEHRVAELTLLISDLPCYPRVCYRHRCNCSSPLMSERHVCAPWGEHLVHNVDKTAHRDAHRCSEVLTMCTSPLPATNTMLTCIDGYMPDIPCVEDLFSLSGTYEQCSTVGFLLKNVSSLGLYPGV